MLLEMVETTKHEGVPKNQMRNENTARPDQLAGKGLQVCKLPRKTVSTFIPANAAAAQLTCCGVWVKFVDSEDTEPTPGRGSTLSPVINV